MIVCVYTVCVSPLTFVWLIIWEAWQEDRFISWHRVPPISLSLFLPLWLSLSLSPSLSPLAVSLLSLSPLFVCLNGSVYVCVSRCLCAEVCVMRDLAAVFVWSVCVHALAFSWCKWTLSDSTPTLFSATWTKPCYTKCVRVCTQRGAAAVAFCYKLADAHTHLVDTLGHTQKCTRALHMHIHTLSKAYSLLLSYDTHTHTPLLRLFEVWR